jgi:beta-glucosidase
VPDDGQHQSKLFGPDFLWGASTAGHQVEGGNHDQWTVWELENAAQLAKTAHQRLGWLPDWPKIETKASEPKNYISGRGVEHYKRYKKDFELLKELNLNAFRFSVEWSRLEPEPGDWDAAAIEHYHDYIDELLARGIEPVLNIWHWTMPVWFTNLGGFAKKSNLKYFENFVQKIADEYGHKVRYIITINEPNVYASFGYLTGEWPPNEKSWPTFLTVYWNLTRAHNRAYKILKKNCPKLQIGVAAQLANVQAKRPHNIIDEAMTKWMRYFWNWWFLNRIKRRQDFIGLNYYFTDYYKGIKALNPKLPLNDLGWYMEPEGIYPLLLRTWVRYKKPIIISENGVADENDQYRRWWLEESMVAMERALSEGVDLRGYLHWSLLDNFEWAYGWWPRFGLVAVDMRDMKRTIRPSAKWWANWLKEARNHKNPEL